MNPERWKQIDEIFHAALDHQPSLRAAFLAEACKEDDSLREEIEALIASHEKESSFFETPPSDLAADLLKGGDEGKIAHYQILKKIGSGGMGDVYLAEDRRLNRKVALKLLPSEFTNDKDRLRRFEREAKAASALNHPNILTIHDIGQFNSVSFIASEYIDGETLRHRMRKTKMPLQEILSISIQVAEALDAAHHSGIIHRDIKPENIMLRKDGYVKVLDFGLAKLVETRNPLNVSNMETFTSQKTQSGVVLGTIRYMSPEQARGLKLDARSDIFSLGVVLYEMITGSLPFQANTPTDQVVAILQKDPPALHIYGEFPEELQWILDKALAKDPDERYQSTKELQTDLKRIRKHLEIEQELKRSDPSTAKVPVKSKPRRTISKKIALFLGVSTLLILLFTIFYSAKKTTTKKDLVPEHHQITFTGKASAPSISPDGKFVAYVSGSSLIVQDVSGGHPLEVFKGDNVHLKDAQPRWSPDGSQIAFTFIGESEHGVFTIPKLGGTPRKISSRVAFPAWSPDGSELALTFQASKDIMFKNLLTGQTRSIPFTADFTWIYDLDWSSLGKLLLVTFNPKTMKFQIWIVNVNGSEKQKILEDFGEVTMARWSGNGKAIYLLVTRGNTKNLMKISFKESDHSISTRTLLSGLEAQGAFSISKNGNQLAYNKEFSFSNLWLAVLQGSSGKQQFEAKQLTTGTLTIYNSSFSPDGHRIVFSMGNKTNSNLYVMNLADGSLHQITFMNSFNDSPAWSPKGDRIAFASYGIKTSRVWTVRSDGEELHELIGTQVSNTAGRTVIWAPSNQILYESVNNRNFYLLDPETEKEKKLIENESVGWVFTPRFSPNGQKLALSWTRKSFIAQYIISLVDSSQTLLKKGNIDAIGWSKDGKWIYAIDHTQAITKISTDDGKTVRLPELPFKDKLPPLQDGIYVDMTSDENQFIFSVPEEHRDIWIVKDFDPDVLTENTSPE